MPDQMTCVDCGQPFSLSAPERARFEQLSRNVEGFQMPKRCFDCRVIKRQEKLSQRPPRVAQKAVVAEIPRRAVAPEIPVARVLTVEPKKDEVRIILATTDFENLVHGKPVVWQGVRVILADIGFKVMRDAIERAETERAKLVFKNGSA